MPPNNYLVKDLILQIQLKMRLSGGSVEKHAYPKGTYVMRYSETRRLVKIVKNDVFVYFCRAFQDLSKMLRVILISRAVAKLCDLETKSCMKDYFEKNAKTDKQTQTIINSMITLG